MDEHSNNQERDVFSSPPTPTLGEEIKETSEKGPISSFSLTMRGGTQIEVQTLKDLIQSAPTEREWAVDGLAPASGLGILGGPPKRGKSTMLIHLARSVATGQPFLERATQRRPAIYINYEMPLDYFSELAKADPIPDNFCVINRPEPRLKMDTVRAIIEAVRERGFERGLLMIDSFRGAFKLRAEQENQSGEAGAILRELQEIGVQTGWLIVLVHHHRKHANQEGAANLSGTGDFSAASDVIWTWNRPADASQPGVLEIEGRVPPIGPFEVKLSPEECTYLGSRQPEVRREEDERKILDTIGSRRLLTKEIETQTGIPESTLQRRLESLQFQECIKWEKAPGKGSPKRWFRIDPETGLSLAAPSQPQPVKEWLTR
jgi:hypothetical protein